MFLGPPLCKADLCSCAPRACAAVFLEVAEELVALLVRGVSALVCGDVTCGCGLKKATAVPSEFLPCGLESGEFGKREFGWILPRSTFHVCISLPPRQRPPPPPLRRHLQPGLRNAPLAVHAGLLW